MDLEAELRSLCDATPDAIGAVLCDFEGETLVSALGASPVPEAAHAQAAEHVPRTMTLEMPVETFLVRLGGAELCALERAVQEAGASLGAGALLQLELHYEAVTILIRGLPNDFYLALVLRRPASTAAARPHLARAASRLAPEVSW